MKRRPKGSGTIEVTRDGRYRARFAFEGTRREDIEGSPFPTPEAAAAALDGVLSLLAATPVAGMSLRRLGEKALDRREKEGYRSVDSERSRWATYVEPWELASAPAKTLSRGDIKELLAEMAKKGLAAQTRRNLLNLIRAVFAYGVDAELLDENPCAGVKVKDRGTTRETSTWLTLEEANALISTATDPAVALAIGTGLRSGELRSLRWEDVHADHIVVRYGAPGEPPKNGKIRHVPLFGIALETLRAMKGKGVVLPNQSGGYRQRGKVVDAEEWKEWKTAAGITRRVRWHDLRHTCATLLLTGAWGRAWSYEEVKEMLGHSSVTVTERYAKATGSLAAKAAAATDKPEISPQTAAAIMTQAREILGSHLRDLNSRPTVYESQHTPNSVAALGGVSGLARAYVEAVARGEPNAHTLGLALADAVWVAEAEAVAS